MRIATWNVNSLRIRLDQVLGWLAAGEPAILGLQETKLSDEQCPTLELQAAGYHALCAGQRSYNGVALLSREPPLAEPLMTELPGFPDPARRVLGATWRFDGRPLRVINLYVPNGQSVGSEKYLYKLAWLEQLTLCLADELARFDQLVVLGDFNIAPEPRDLSDPEAWEGHLLFSPPEREAFRALLALGLVDAFRLHHPEAGHHSWWDYRAGAFRRNRGLRIDHLLVSPALARRCRAAGIDRGPRGHARPSDHAPVWADFS